jgi:hypothetical protein
MIHPDYDAVGLVRRIRDQLHEETKDMSHEEIIAFYRRHAARTQEKLRARSKSTASRRT